MAGLKPVRVRISNYQSVEHVEFEVEGFTCIRGGTNIGKSAILRAISGALLNTPAVHKVRRGHKYATVELQSEDWGVKWEKGEAVTRYWLPGDEKPRTAVGQGQADFVAAMGFQGVDVGKDHIYPWYASQHETIFLLNQSGPSVTEFISEVSRLKVLQDAITINVRAREQAVRDAKASESEAAAARSALEPFRDLASLEGVPASLEDQLESIEEYERRIDQLERIRIGIEREEAAVARLASADSVRAPSGPSRDAEKLEQGSSFLLKLEGSARAVIAVKGIEQVKVPAVPAESARLEIVPKAVAALELAGSLARMEESLSRPMPDRGPAHEAAALEAAVRALQPLEAARDRVAALSGAEEVRVPLAPADASKLETALEMLRKLEAEALLLIEAESRLRDAEKELADVEKELASIPTCPTCRQVMPRRAEREHAH